MTPFDWEEYLELAEKLVAWRGDPAAERSAISRAYYAAFHKAKTYFLVKGGRLTFQGEDHGAVADWFKDSVHRDLRKIGIDVERLRRLRRVADYDERFAHLSNEAQAAVTLARRTVDVISGLR
ncbi:MAG: HEPN domain-containing protein [Thermomicrobiales bacterium]